MEDLMPDFCDDYHELWDVVMGLEMVYREAVLLYFYERLTIREIAKALHVPEGTVKSRLSRGKKRSCGKSCRINDRCGSFSMEKEARSI